MTDFPHCDNSTIAHAHIHELKIIITGLLTSLFKEFVAFGNSLKDVMEAGASFKSLWTDENM